MKKAIALLLLAITVLGVAYVSAQTEPTLNYAGTGRNPPRK